MESLLFPKQNWANSKQVIQFQCSFQNTLNGDIKNKITKPNTILIPADKITNFYAMNPSSYDKLIINQENIAKTYKKSNEKFALDAKSAKKLVQLASTS